LSEAEEHFNAGADLHRQGRFEEAITDYDEAIRLDPQLALAYYNRGVAYQSMGQPQRAIQDYDEAIRLDPQYAPAYVNRGIIYRNLGQPQRAIQDYDEAIRLDPQDAPAYLNRGNAYVALGQPQRAIQDYDEAIRLDPQFALAYSNRGHAYQSMGQLQRAIGDYDEAIRLDPQLAPAYGKRGVAYQSMGQLQRAIQDYDEAIRLDPQNALHYANRARAYTVLGRDSDALQDFDRAVELGFDPVVLKQAMEQLVPLPLDETYVSELGGYSINYPGAWSVQMIGPIIIILSTTGTNMTLSHEPTLERTFDEFVAIFLDGYEIGQTSLGLSFSEASRETVSNPSGLLIQGQSVGEGLPDFVITIFLTEHEGNFVAIAGIVRDSLRELHQPIIERMLGSLMLFEPTASTADDHGNSPGAATGLAPGESVTGSIDSGVDVDYFTFSGAAGKTYMAEIELGSLKNAILLLESDGGTCILNGSVDFNNTGAPLFRWPVPTDGTYYLRVENADGISKGGYTLHLSETMDAPTDDHGNDFCAATAIDVADGLAGSISEPADVDWFMFSAEAGTTYIIVVTLGTLDDSLLGLWDTDGITLLELNDDFGSTLASRIQWAAPKSGIYFFDVENAAGVGVGTYTVTVTAEP